MITLNGNYQNTKLVKDYLVEMATQNKLWLAMGSGNDSWDENLPTSVTNKDRLQLVKEVVRVKVEPDDIQLVAPESDPDSDIIVDDAATTIRVLGNIVCPLIPLREYGLFINASETVNTGKLYAYDVHPKVILGQLHLYMKYVYINF